MMHDATTKEETMATMTATTCECAQYWSDGGGDSGGPCTQALGRAWVRMTFVPLSERGSARASGAYTAYGGAAELRITRGCWATIEDSLLPDDRPYVSLMRYRSAATARAATLAARRT
jgi:hypothetical protein